MATVTLQVACNTASRTQYVSEKVALPLFAVTLAATVATLGAGLVVLGIMSFSRMKRGLIAARAVSHWIAGTAATSMISMLVVWSTANSEFYGKALWLLLVPLIPALVVRAWLVARLRSMHSNLPR